MARERATITVDRSKVRVAQHLIGAPPMAATVDFALDRLIQAEPLRSDVRVYQAASPMDCDREPAATGSFDDLDDVDWDLLYGDVA